MHLFKSVLAGAALVAATVAQDVLSFTSFPEDVSVGTPVTVTWAGGNPDEPVTISLRRGPSDNLGEGEILTSDATGGSYTWTPSDNLVDGDDYALMISQGEDINYTGQFSIEGGSGSETTTGATTGATTDATTDATDITVTLSSVGPSTTSGEPITTTEAVTTTEAETSAAITSSASPSFSTTIAPQNTTMSVPTLTSSIVSLPTPTPTGPAETTGAAPDSAASSAAISSPLALIMGVIAAVAYLN